MENFDAPRDANGDSESYGVVYLAGPLFTGAERQWNMRLKEAFEALRYRVLLPQDLEGTADFSNPIDLAKRIFLGDKEAIDKADFVIACMDGPDPDSGTAWECGYAYAKGKAVITYRTDMRNLLDPTKAKFNLMLTESSFVLDLGAEPWLRSPTEIASSAHAAITRRA